MAKTKREYYQATCMACERKVMRTDLVKAERADPTFMCMRCRSLKKRIAICRWCGVEFIARRAVSPSMMTTCPDHRGLLNKFAKEIGVSSIQATRLIRQAIDSADMLGVSLTPLAAMEIIKRRRQ